MNGLATARAALTLMGCIAGGILTVIAFGWCIAVLWIALEPEIRDRLDARDARRARNPYEWHVETRTDWRTRKELRHEQGTDPD